MKLRPTVLGTKGLVFAALLVGAYFATPYSNLYFLMLALLVCLAGFSVLETRRHLRRVQVRVRELPALAAESPLEFEIEVDPGRRAVEGLDLCIHIEGRETMVHAAGLVRGATVLVHREPGLPRGVYRFAGAEVATTWPFGVVRASRPAEAPKEIVVHPRRGQGGEDGGSAGGEGEVPSISSGRGQPAGLREFRDGDELRRVDARASARRGRLVVAEWDDDQGDELHVVLDRRMEAAAFEEALCSLSELAGQAREREEGIVVASQGLVESFGGAGGRPWSELLRWLALVKPLAEDEAPPSAPPGAVRLGGRIEASPAARRERRPTAVEVTT